MRKSIKERLADRVNKDLELSARFEADDFKRNHGATQYNDYCCWEARSGTSSICSWTSMTELVRQKQPLRFIGDTNEVA